MPMKGHSCNLVLAIGGKLRLDLSKLSLKKKKSYFNKINPSNLLGNLGKFQLTLIHINT